MVLELLKEDGIVCAQKNPCCETGPHPEPYAALWSHAFFITIEKCYLQLKQNNIFSAEEAASLS